MRESGGGPSRCGDVGAAATAARFAATKRAAARRLIGVRHRLWHQLVTAEPYHPVVQVAHCSHRGTATLVVQIRC
jgi:hypothetical protein